MITAFTLGLFASAAIGYAAGSDEPMPFLFGAVMAGVAVLFWLA